MTSTLVQALSSGSFSKLNTSSSLHLYSDQDFQLQTSFLKLSLDLFSLQCAWLPDPYLYDQPQSESQSNT
jgi:hypothetical protein